MKRLPRDAIYESIVPNNVIDHGRRCTVYTTVYSAPVEVKPAPGADLKIAEEPASQSI